LIIGLQHGRDKSQTTRFRSPVPRNLN
jgi:hypothetical protein